MTYTKKDSSGTTDSTVQGPFFYRTTSRLGFIEIVTLVPSEQLNFVLIPSNILVSWLYQLLCYWGLLDE